ncbi:MAG: fatty acid--CoA ligase [Chitinophagaceae bacterium]|nr:fatty acid--CoA ligase [Chitinophagaceae bacterium]
MVTSRLIKPTRSAYDPPMLIKSILEQSLKYEPDRAIHYRDLVQMNYRDLNKRICKLANALKSMGVKEGDVIGIIEFDSHRYLELYFAVPMIGAVMHTINYRLSPEQAGYTMNHAEDKVLFFHKTFVPLVTALRPALQTVEKYVLLKDDEAMPENADYLFGEYEDLISKESDEYDFPDFDENTMATLFYTTGTTGLPKGVCFSHRQLFLHTIGLATAVSAIDSPVRVKSTDVYMPLTPMFHVHAWGMPYLATMLGMKQVYPGPYEPEMLMKLILGHRVTFSHCVPTILGMLVNNPKVRQLDVSFFRVIIGGSALPKGLAKGAMEMGIDIIAGYGMSETCPVLTLPYLSTAAREGMTIDQQVEERIKTGRPVLFVDLKIADDDGNFLPFDGKSIGEIVVRAPWLTQTYYKEEERSEELWKGGYMHTGDMAYVEPNGTVVIVDRKKDVIKSGGEWISSLALESIISAYTGVKESAVVGVPDPKWDERPLALVVLADGAQVTADDLKKHLEHFVNSGHLSKWAVPDEIKVIAEIPKTSVGKIDKKLIRKKLEAKEI